MVLANGARPTQRDHGQCSRARTDTTIALEVQRLAARLMPRVRILAKVGRGLPIFIVPR